MANTPTNAESQLLAASALVNLYILDLNPIANPLVLYFHDGANQYYQPITFNGQAYTPFPITIKDFGYNGDGTIARPKIQVSNIGGFVSNLLLQGQDLEGAFMTRRRVFSKFLDAVNFVNGNPNADPTAAYPDEVFIINRKTQENNVAVEWELAPPFDLQAQKIPNRQMLGNFCGFRYRSSGDGCPYAMLPPIADQNSKLFVGGPGTYGLATLNNRGAFNTGTIYNSGDYFFTYSPLPALAGIPQCYVVLQQNVSGFNPIGNTTVCVLDACQKTLAADRLRFVSTAVSPFGGFLGVARAPYSLGVTQPE